MRRFLGICALSLILFGSAHAIAAVDRVILGRALILHASVSGGAVLDCTAKATGNVAVLTTIQRCRVTSSRGGSIKGITPVTFPGSNAATVGAGKLRPGVFRACVSGRATYFLPSQTISKTRCFNL